MLTPLLGSPRLALARQSQPEIGAAEGERVERKVEKPGPIASNFDRLRRPVARYRPATDRNTNSLVGKRAADSGASNPAAAARLRRTTPWPRRVVQPHAAHRPGSRG